MIQEIRIGTNRVGSLIGKGGLTKRKLEEKTGAAITIDSEEGLVKVEGEDPVGALRAAEVVTAIGRGFSPERAFILLEDDDLVLDVIDLSGIEPSPQQQERLRGRIIGKAGRAREQIENMAGIELSVQGKTVAMIGLPDQLKNARTAIDMLINGVPHEAVFSFLEKKRREEKEKNILDYYY
ncbi:KH domain-containing protein [Methanofollis tationis]|uniref:RNA-processing protein n=1 Tax=Methanofollis tationis TaxID=81417 RepID=A0A7K4HNU7_9EURY|nr:KH domain-containing protein [Methanofollis tationis]NVO66953.1 RNA-processing protein [Methanofollis tationis]